MLCGFSHLLCIFNTKDLSNNVGYDSEIVLRIRCTTQMRLITYYSDSLFCSALCGHVSKHLPAQAVALKNASQCQGVDKGSNFWIIDKSQRYLNFNDFGHGGSLRFVNALFNQSKNIKASSNFTMSQPLIYFRNSRDPTANKTSLDDETETCVDGQDAAARTYYCHSDH